MKILRPTINRWFFITICTLLSLNGLAQEKMTLAAKEFMQPYQMEEAQSRSNKSQEFHTKLDLRQIQTLIKRRPNLLEVEMYDDRGNLHALELEINDFFAAEFLEEGANEPHDNQNFYNPFKHGVHYKGKVKNSPSSTATFSFYGTEIRGSIEVGGQEITISLLDKEKQLYRTFVEEQYELNCDSNFDVLDDTRLIPENSPVASSRSNSNCVGVTIFTVHGVSSSHATSIFNECSANFASFGINLQLLSINHFGNAPVPTPDRHIDLLLLDHATNPSGSDISVYISDNFLVGGVAKGLGIIGQSTAVCVARDRKQVVAHEIGHLLGAHHTHQCAWNGNNTPIDGCNAPDKCGNGPIPDCGTIMSYCEVTFPSCVKFEFHPQVKDRMLNFVQSHSTCGGGGNGGGGNGGGGGGTGGCASRGGDSDGDGVCDWDDCNPFDPIFPQAPGTPCVDLTPNTINDQIQADGCTCAGMVSPCASQGGDSDGDGVCNTVDCAPNDANFPKPVGTPCNDGDINTINDQILPGGCSCQGTFDACAAKGGDADGDGICNEDDCAPNDPNYPKPVGTACNDGNANTTNDQIQADGCTCQGAYTITNTCPNSSINLTTAYRASNLPVGTSITWHTDKTATTDNQITDATNISAGRYYAAFYDANEGCYSTNTTEVIVQIITCGPCAASGGDSDGDGICNNDDCAPNDANFPKPAGTACNDGNANTINDQILSDGCTCRGTFDVCAASGGDSDGDGICNNEDCAPNDANFPKPAGTACNDGNANTINDQILSDGCTCRGTFDVCAASGGDSDGDGVCNNNDCAPNDANYPKPAGTACNDGNANTINDQIQADGCTCQGNSNFASIGNEVFNDRNNNGLKDANELGISGVVVNLLDANNTQMRSTTTDGNGNYRFDNLQTGEYKIQFNTPADFKVAPQTGFTDDDTDNNNDINPADNNRTAKIFLSPSENNQTIDAGFTSSTSPPPPPTGDCTDVTVSGTNGQIALSNIPTGATIDYNGPTTGWAVLFHCANDCGTTQIIPHLKEGEYNVKIQSYNPYCYANYSVTVTSGGGNTGGGGTTPTDADNDGVPATEDCNDNDANLTTIGAACNDGNPNTTNDVVQANCTCVGTNSNTGGGGNTGELTTESCGGNTTITYGNGEIKMAGQAGVEHYFQVFDKDWQEVYNCGWQCGNSKTVTGLAAGEYRVYIKNSSYQNICEKVITLSANTGGGGNSGGGGTTPTDYDNDGVPAIEDCNDNDANLTTVGAACNDGNANTTNDVVQANCTCAGTDANTGGGTSNTATCGEITITYSNGTIDLTGHTGKDYYFKINDMNAGWAQAGGCSWNCGHQFTADQLPNSQYLVTIYNSDWSEHCSQEIAMTSSSYTRNAGSRKAARLSFSAFRANRAVELQWLSNSGYKVSDYQIERSQDGVSFEPIEELTNKAWTEDLAFHQTMDEQPTKGTNYYRVKESYSDGSFAYTDVQQVGFQIDLERLSIYPNPAENVLNLNLKPILGKSVSIHLINTFGQVVQSKKLGIIEQEIGQIPLEQSVPNGFYQVLIEIEGHQSVAKKLIIKRMY